ncbi:MAG: thioesterase [Phycisphaeraceae bacterium]|nr:MAG: thioesterase [Phycisphaeraceae bacterium]
MPTPAPVSEPAPGDPPPTQGAVRVRVRYSECDPMGVAHHASYAPWLEMARTELLRDGGRTYEAMEREGVFLVVTRLEIKYRRPIRYDDVLEIRTRVGTGSRVRVRHDYDIALIERAGASPDPTDPAVPHDGVTAIGVTELACVGRDGRPRELPAWLGGGGPA